jgi:hypothetical protein
MHPRTTLSMQATVPIHIVVEVRSKGKPDNELTRQFINEVIDDKMPPSALPVCYM